MSVPTINPGTDILSEQYNKLVRLFTGAPGAGSDTPVSFTRSTSAASPALTVRHRVTDDADYKGLLVQDKDGDTAFEVSALGSGPYEGLIFAYAPKLIAGNLRNWDPNADFYSTHVTYAAGSTGSFVGAKFILEDASRGDIAGGSIVDSGPLSSIMLAKNVASGAGQNAQGTFRAGEFQCLVFGSTSATENCMGLDIGMHTAVLKTGILDDIASQNWGDVGAMIQSSGQGFTGYGTAQTPNAGVIVTGPIEWKWGFAYARPDKTLLWGVKNGGSTLQAGNAHFTATSQRIFADFSNATNALRLLFETTTANGVTLVGAKPVGAGSQAGFEGYSGSDVSVSGGVRVSASVIGGAVLESFKTGAATAPSIFISPGGTARLEFDLVGNVRFPDAGLATNAAAGFLYIPSCAGVPTGGPSVFAGTVPIVFDRTNDKLSVYRGGWKQTAALV